MGAVPYLSAAPNANAVGALASFYPLGSCASMGPGNSEAIVQVKHRTPGTLSDFSVNIRLNTDTGTATARVRKNTANGNGVILIPPGGTGHFQDLVNTDTIADGDLLAYSLVRGAANTLTPCSFGTVFEATSGTVSRWTLSSGAGPTNGTFLHLAGADSDGLTEAQAETAIPVSGTLSNAGIHIGTNTRDGITTVRLRIDQADTAIVLSIGIGVTGWVEDLVNTVDVTAGQRGAWGFTLAGTTGIINVRTAVLDYTTTGRVPFATSDFNGVNAGTTMYAPVVGLGDPWDTAEADTEAKALIPHTLSRLTCNITANTDDGIQTLRLRKNNAPGTLAIAIPPAGTGWFSDLVNTDTAVASDVLNYQRISAGGSGTSVWRFIGMAGGVEPIVPLPIPTTPGPQTPCSPQSQVGNGGKGNAGCNTGGVGWTSSYDGAMGDVPQHADPTQGELLTDKYDVDIWVEVDVINYPMGGTTTYRRSMQGIPDVPAYYGGWKPPSLTAIGDLEHGLGNEHGGFEAAAADVEWSDTVDRLFRTLLIDQDLEGNEARIYAASRVAREASLPPRLLFRGVVQRAALSSSLLARLTIVDPLFADGGPFGPDRQWPPLIPQFTNVTNTPSETLQTALSPCYGEKSDEGAIDPVSHVQLSKGLVPFTWLGQVTLPAEDSPDPNVYIQDLTIPRPEIASITNIIPYTGQDGFHDTTYIWFAAYRISDGRLGPFALNPHTGTEVVYELNPAGEENEEGRWPHIHFMFIDDEPNPDYQYIGFVSTIPSYHPITNPNPGGQRGIAVHDGVTADSFYERDDGRDASLRVPVQAPVDAAAPNNDWDVYLAAWGACYRGISLFGSNLGGGIPSNTPDRVRLDLDTRNGSDLLWPWMADGSLAAVWPYATPYVDWVATDGHTYRLTVLLARGPLSDDHKNGVVNLTTNLIGIEDVGDGTGLPILEAHSAEQHWLDNFVLNHYTSGLWATTSTAAKWADGTSKVRSARFTSRQAYTAAALGGDGLLVSWYPDTPKGLLEHVAEWNYSTETKLGVNGDGRLTLGYLDDTIDPANWTHIQHIRDIFGPVASLFGDNRENVVRGDCDYDPDGSRFRSVIQQFQSTVGYTKYKNRWKAGDVLHSTILGRQEQFDWVLQRRLDRLRTGEINVSIEGPMGWLDTDVDAPGILLTTLEGRGTTGYVADQMWLRRRAWNFGSRKTTYALQDISDIPLGLRFRNVSGSAGNPNAGEAFSLTESISARLNPQPISLSEGLELSDAISVRLNPQPVGVTSEGLRIGEHVVGVVI